MVRIDMNRNYRLIRVWVRFDQGLIEGCFDRLYMGNDGVMGMDWERIGKRVDLQGKIGVSKIVREIEGKVIGKGEWGMGKLGERVDLSGV